jgi:hypothetical protein
LVNEALLNFIMSALGMKNKQELSKLLDDHSNEIDINTFKYFLAIEDFDVFQIFMIERNKKLNELTL